MAAPVKKKRISKKTKAAWRKTDINDVEAFLEEQRQDERIGGSLFAEKKDEDLFTVDAAPQKPRRGLTEKQKRKLNAKKPMKSFQAMENTSKVQDPIAKRNHVKPKKNGRNIEDEIRNPSKPRHVQANKDRGHYYDKLEKRLNKSGKALRFNKDVWAESDFRDKMPGLKDEKGWISEDLALHVMRNKGKPVVKVHGSLRHRTTKAKNFEPPHPGTSYNPSLEDHQELLNKVVQREEKIIKVEKHLKRITTDMFSKVTPEERDARKLFEMQAGLDDDDNNNDDGGATNDKDENTVEHTEVNDAPYQTVNPPVEVKKKSKQARRKELKQKELQKKQTEKKALKKQVADLNRIKSIKAEVMAEEEALNALKKHRKVVAHKKKFEPKRLGRLKYEEPDQDINMADEITGDLRNLKAGSSLLVDRFKNFQKRNILPVSVDVGKKKKKKIKRFVRSTHKEPGVTHEMLREQRKAKAKEAAAQLKV